MCIILKTKLMEEKGKQLKKLQNEVGTILSTFQIVGWVAKGRKLYDKYTCARL